MTGGRGGGPGSGFGLNISPGFTLFMGPIGGCGMDRGDCCCGGCGSGCWLFCFTPGIKGGGGGGGWKVDGGGGGGNELPATLVGGCGSGGRTGDCA